MGQKVHPGGLRVGVIHDWKSNWYTSKKEFKGALLEDIKIREHINRKLGHAGLSDILIRKDKQRIFTPCAPERIAEASERFIARRNDTRFWSCSAIDWATSFASSSGRLISLMLMWTFLCVIA